MAKSGWGRSQACKTRLYSHIAGNATMGMFVARPAAEVDGEARLGSAEQRSRVITEQNATHTHVASISAGPRVSTIVTRAAIRVQTITVCRNVPVGSKLGSGLAAQ